jgi:hypothetical protein
MGDDVEMASYIVERVVELSPLYMCARHKDELFKALKKLSLTLPYRSIRPGTVIKCTSCLNELNHGITPNQE